MWALEQSAGNGYCSLASCGGLGGLITSNPACHALRMHLNLSASPLDIMPPSPAWLPAPETSEVVRTCVIMSGAASYRPGSQAFSRHRLRAILENERRTVTVAGSAAERMQATKPKAHWFEVEAPLAAGLINQIHHLGPRRVPCVDKVAGDQGGSGGPKGGCGGGGVH